MSEREPITGELRELMGGVEPRVDEDGVVTAKYVTPEAWGEFTRRCDAIDSIHAGLECENAELRERVAVLDNERGNMHETDAWKLGYDEGFASADDWLGQHEDAMAEHGWVRLPLDADGVPIRVGDVMEWPTTYETFEVVGIGDGTLFYIEDGRERADWTGASTKRHHHAPTVEDVLTKFGIDWEYEDNCEDRAALLAEYAAKLRLAGGDAE